MLSLEPKALYIIGKSSTTELCSWIPGPIEPLRHSRGATLTVSSEAGTLKHGLKENNSHTGSQRHPGVVEVTIESIWGKVISISQSHRDMT